MLSEDEKTGLGVALNEATLLDVLVRRPGVVCVFEVLTLPEQGPPPDDRIVLVVLAPVYRIAASLRHGRWDDEGAAVEAFELDALGEVVRSFGGCPIYGWEFVDPPEQEWTRWRDRLSLDERWDLDADDADDGHVLELFQESQVGPPRHLDLRIWFGHLNVYREDHSKIPLAEFVAGGQRWWDALFAGDSRTQGHGIVAGSPPRGRFARLRRAVRRRRR